MINIDNILRDISKTIVSVVNRKGVVAFFALVEDCGSLVCTPDLGHVIFELVMIAPGTLLIGYHFSLASPFLQVFAGIILVQPLFILLNFQTGFDGLP